MSILDLTPRIYGRDMQWKISPKNIISTVSSNPIINNVAEDPQSIRTLTYKKAVHFESTGDRELTLPIDTSRYNAGLSIPDELLYARSYRTDMAWGASHELAKARVDVIGGHIFDSIVLDSPIAGIPQAAVSVKGKSYVCARSRLEYSNYPSAQNLLLEDFDLSSWIYEHHTEEQDYLQATYGDFVPLMPFVSSSGYTQGRVFYGTPESSDFWCKFNTGMGTGAEQGATYDSWVVGQDVKLGRVVRPENWNGNFDAQARLPDKQQRLGVKLTRGVDKYHYDLHAYVPISVAWAAASRYYGALNNEYFLDSFAFLDLITEISVEIFGRPYNTEDVVYNYSLDSSGNLVNATKNDNAYKIDNNELITVSSTIDGQDWMSGISKILLDKYKNGKYVVRVKVPAKWAILNNVHINTLIRIKTLEGDYVSRAGIPCIFEVKIIIKKFEGSSFNYELQLMEV